VEDAINRENSALQRSPLSVLGCAKIHLFNTGVRIINTYASATGVVAPAHSTCFAGLHKKSASKSPSNDSTCMFVNKMSTLCRIHACSEIVHDWRCEVCSMTVFQWSDLTMEWLSCQYINPEELLSQSESAARNIELAVQQLAVVSSDQDRNMKIIQCANSFRTIIYISRSLFCVSVQIELHSTLLLTFRR
jgi:hypothetical protein